MPTSVNSNGGLNSREFASARKRMLIERTADIDIWERANKWQQEVLHQLELTVKHLTLEDLQALEAQIKHH